MVNKDTIEKFYHEIPIEVWIAIKPLSNKESCALFIALLKENKIVKRKHMRDLFEVTDEELNKILMPLVNSGLIDQRSKLKDIGDLEKAIYNPTFLGKSIMRSLYKAVMLGDPDVRSGLV